ncbi:phosphonate C-P lyase system protein PhnL [Marinobacter fonticola]|uniref:phosphonate C-P lyase system protein PhnL n=1 Tax=Marinobacter fonticola TaxID=2603215 RepID=UPI0011E7C629|nr:phosphonate C-P lyase system protein PhnL [Marinobacter fonticola]
MGAMIQVENLSKSFTLHQQHGITLDVLRNINLNVDAGECVVLGGRSGSGKSTLMRLLYANYRAQSGSLRIRGAQGWVDLARAHPRQIWRLRRETLGYVSQFLRVVPRVTTLDIVMEPMLELGVDRDEAETRASTLLQRLNIPQRLWSLAPATFSGGEQQRVNIARGFAVGHPILLLDEPTASLDPANREQVVRLIHDAKQAGSALVGIFHDTDVRDQVADRIFEIAPVADMEETA